MNKEKYKTAAEVSKQKKIPYQTVWSNFKKYRLVTGDKATNRVKANSISPQTLIAKYQELKSARLTAQHFGINKDQVLARIPKELKEKKPVQ